MAPLRLSVLVLACAISVAVPGHTSLEGYERLLQYAADLVKSGDGAPRNASNPVTIHVVPHTHVRFTSTEFPLGTPHFHLLPPFVEPAPRRTTLDG